MESFVDKKILLKAYIMLINPNGFREYDARWIFEKDIDLEGIEQLGKGLGSQIINQTRNWSKNNNWS